MKIKEKRVKEISFSLFRLPIFWKGGDNGIDNDEE